MWKYSIWKLAIVSHSSGVWENAGINDTCRMRRKQSCSGQMLDFQVQMVHQTLIPPGFVPNCWSVNWLNEAPVFRIRPVEECGAGGWFLQPSRPHTCPFISISQPSAAALARCCCLPSQVWLTPQVFDFSLMITGEKSFFFSHLDYFVRIPGLNIKQTKVRRDDWSL